MRIKQGIVLLHRYTSITWNTHIYLEYTYTWNTHLAFDFKGIHFFTVINLKDKFKVRKANLFIPILLLSELSNTTEIHIHD